MTELFLKLLNMSISAGWIVLAVVVLRFLLKKSPRYLVCMLWGIVALRLMIPYFGESPWSLIPSAEVIPQNVATAPAIKSGIPAFNSAVNPVLGSQVASGQIDLAAILQIAAVIWLIGIAAMLIYSAITYLRLYGQVQASVRISGNIYLCDYIQSPFILGILRPRIYIPSGIEHNQLQYVLAHETAHIKRKDHWWKPLGFLLLSVYWFHPLMWVAYILLCKDIECACDEKVVCGMDDAGKKGYSHALIDCSAHRRMIMACPLAFGEVSVKQRIKGVLNYKKPAFWIVAMTAALCLVMAACSLTNPRSCRHTYTGEITVPASCTQLGVQTFTCQQCYYCYTEPLPKLEHNYAQDFVVQQPSCTQPGRLQQQCLACGAVSTQIIPVTDHIAAEPYFVKEPNCTQTGEESATCSVCQTVFVTQVLQTNDLHDLVETVIKPATCAEPGEGEKTCSRCGYSEPCTYEPLAHTYGSWRYVFAATCTKEGMAEQSCTQCGKLNTKTEPKTDHYWTANGPWQEICLFCMQSRATNQATDPYSLIEEDPSSQLPENILPGFGIWP